MVILMFLMYNTGLILTAIGLITSNTLLIQIACIVMIIATLLSLIIIVTNRRKHPKLIGGTLVVNNSNPLDDTYRLVLESEFEELSKSPGFIIQVRHV